VIVGESRQEVAGGLGGPRSGRVGGDPCEVDPACGDFDHEQDVEPVQERGVDTREVGGNDRLRLGADELRPGRSGAVATRVDACGAQDLPHGRRSNSATETVDFAVDPAVAPRRVLPGQTEDHPQELGIDGRTTRSGGRWLGPVAGDESSVPGEDRRRAHDQQRPAASGSVHHGCEQHKDRSIGLVEAWPIDLALQHEDLMAQSQDLGITGVTAGEQPSQPSQDE